MKDLLIKNLASLATNRGKGPRGGKSMGEILEITHPWVLVRDGKIHRIGGEELEKEAVDAQIIDGEGKTLLPGFVDPHTHLVFVTIASIPR